MNKLLLLLTPFALGVSLPAQSIATEAAESHSAYHARPASPVLSVLDIDNNGVLSTLEIAQAAVTLAALDLDGDGNVSAAEFAASGSDRAGESGSNLGSEFNLVFNLDANNDRCLQQLEIANAAHSLKRMDANLDGTLTRDELDPTAIVTQPRF